MSEPRSISGLMALVDDYADHFADSRSAGLTVADAIVLSGKKREILYYAKEATVLADEIVALVKKSPQINQTEAYMKTSPMVDFLDKRSIRSVVSKTEQRRQ